MWLLWALWLGCGDKDDDGFTKGKGDCDDAAAGVHPDAVEVCNGVDDDCDGAVDEDATDALTAFEDSDGDGYGKSDVTTTACAVPDGYAAEPADCDDDDSAVHPDATESCNDVDDDCDGSTDEAAVDQAAWSTDADSDGYGDPDDEPILACDAIAGRVDNADDCDDANFDVHPGATEVCDPANVDEDCSGDADDDDPGVDPATTRSWWPDADDDGYGDGAIGALVGCDRPEDHVDDGTDCDDAVPTVYPGAVERCDGLDSDCDPTTEDAGRVWFIGADDVADDVTGAWSAGTATSPAKLGLEEDGTLEVCDGTWYVNLDVTAAALTIRGPSGPAATILDGANLGSIVDANEAGAVTIEGLTLQNGNGNANAFGSGAEGGAAACSEGGTLTVADVWFLDNTARIGGAIAAISGCTIDIVDSQFDGNTATWGAGVLAYDSVAMTIDATTFTSGTASATGGGIYAQGLDDTTITTLTLTDVLFSQNSATYGGALGLLSSAEASCAGSSTVTAGFHGNTAATTAAIYLVDGTSTFDAVVCDFGADGSGNDNTAADLVDMNGRTYEYGDDQSFGCDGSKGCK